MKFSYTQHIVVLHGGLGNQLFQYFRARTTTVKNKTAQIFLISDFLGRYSSPREIELTPLIELGASDQPRFCESNILLKLRLSKLIKRITGREFTLFVPGYGVIMDGYFQELRHYQKCPPSVLAAVLTEWRQILSKRLALSEPRSGRITHIRLGDFFNDDETARSFAVKQLSAICEPSDLVTDREDMLTEELAKLKLSHPVQLLPSAHMSAWDLMALMCRYETISTNGSTLAFWSAVIGGAQLHTTNREHVHIWRHLIEPI
jgi:hypothetical protein